MNDATRTAGQNASFATRYADFLEQVAVRVRSLTIDRVLKAVRVVALALPALVLALMAVIFLLLTIHGALAIPLGHWAAFAVEGGLFLLAGTLLWRKRSPKQG